MKSSNARYQGPKQHENPYLLKKMQGQAIVTSQSKADSRSGANPYLQ